QLDDLLPPAGGVEAAHQTALQVGSERVLELVAVAPGLYGGHHRLELEVVQPPDPPQGVLDLGVLDLELALVGKDLPWSARMGGPRLEPVGARLEDLDR